MYWSAGITPILLNSPLYIPVTIGRNLIPLYSGIEQFLYTFPF
jgi:hypothetical protein